MRPLPSLVGRLLSYHPFQKGRRERRDQGLFGPEPVVVLDPGYGVPPLPRPVHRGGPVDGLVVLAVDYLDRTGQPEDGVARGGVVREGADRVRFGLLGREQADRGAEAVAEQANAIVSIPGPRDGLGDVPTFATPLLPGPEVEAQTGDPPVGQFVTYCLQPRVRAIPAVCWLWWRGHDADLPTAIERCPDVP